MSANPQSAVPARSLVGRAARALTLEDLGLLLRIAGLTGVVSILWRLCSLPRLAGQLDTTLPERPATLERADRIIRLTDALLVRLYRRSFCFPRSLVLFRLLRKEGYPVQIHLGITRKGHQLKGHAWLELDGAPFAERKPPHGTYQRVYVYPHVSIHQPMENTP